MSARGVVFMAGIVGGLAWLIKVGLIWGNGGTNTDQGVVALFYFLGLGGLVVACVACGAWLTARRSVWIRALASLGGAVAFFVAFGLLDMVLSPVASLADEGHWFQDEVEIIAAALLGLAVAAVARTRRAGVVPVG